MDCDALRLRMRGLAKPTVCPSTNPIKRQSICNVFLVALSLDASFLNFPSSSNMCDRVSESFVLCEWVAKQHCLLKFLFFIFLLRLQRWCDYQNLSIKCSFFYFKHCGVQETLNGAFLLFSTFVYKFNCSTPGLDSNKLRLTVFTLQYIMFSYQSIIIVLFTCLVTSWITLFQNC